MTTLWKEDPLHKEWDFMCAVYSTAREFLSDENVTLQNWIQFAIKHMGIVARESYLATLGWRLVQLEDGTHKVERTVVRGMQSYPQPMNGLGLFMSCLNDGLPVSNPLPIITKLSNLADDIIYINTQPGTAAKQPMNTMEGFRQFAKNHPNLAMSALFQVPTAHPLIMQGVTVHHVDQLDSSPATEQFSLTQKEDPELDAMLNKIFQAEGGGGIGNQGSFVNQYPTMGIGMGNGTPGESQPIKHSRAVFRTLKLTKSQAWIETITANRRHAGPTTTATGRIVAASKLDGGFVWGHLNTCHNS